MTCELREFSLPKGVWDVESLPKDLAVFTDWTLLEVRALI